MSHILKGKQLSTGTHHLMKQKADASTLREVEWQTTLSNNIRFQSGQLIRLEYRYAPQNESLESVFLDYRLTNNSGGDVEVLPLWPSIREMRIFINQKKVLDLNREEEMVMMWKNKLLTDYHTDKARDNAVYVRTGESTTLDPATGQFQPVTIPAGQSHQFHLEFSDWCDLLSQALPLNRVASIEVEFNLSSRGDFVCSPQAAVADLQVDNLSCYSRHKRFAGLPPPTAMNQYTLMHHGYDIFQIQPSQHPFAVANSTYDVNISYEFPKRRYIKRLILFSRDSASPDAFRDQQSDWVQSLDLLSGGVTQLGVENHYKSERRIYHEVSEYLRRHHNVALPTHGNDLGHGVSFPTCFVDLTTVKHSQVCNASERLTVVTTSLTWC
jgi:hypothetical protein